MKIFIAYCFGLIGFLLQGGAVIGLPVYVIFFEGSPWWMLAFFPLGFAGMMPLGIMSSMLKNNRSMNFFFWKKKKYSSLDEMSRGLMVTATDPDKCWETASLFRKTNVPGNVLTCETSFLMGSIARDIIRSVIAEEAQQRKALMSAEAAYFKTFDDQSEEELPPEMTAVYGNVRLGHVARIALAAYGEQSDMLFLTSSIFVRRIKGDPRMADEVIPLLEERKAVLSTAFSQVIK